MLSKRRIPEGVSCRFDVKRTIKEEGGMIDYSRDARNVQPWLYHPETYPTSFRNKKIYLWKTLDSRPGFRRILAMSWCNGVVLLFWRKLDMRGTNRDPLDS